MNKPKVYKVYCKYFIKANNLEAVENYVSEEIIDGEFYERHISIDPYVGLTDDIIDIDVDLTTNN